MENLEPILRISYDVNVRFFHSWYNSIRLEPSLHVQLYLSFEITLNVIRKNWKRSIKCKQALKTVFRVTGHEKDVDQMISGLGK